MNKKLTFIALGFLAICAVVLLAVKPGYAKGTDDLSDTGGGKTWQEGLLYDEMIAALANVLGMDADDLETRLNAGEKMADIAVKQGISKTDWPTKLKTAMTTAIKQALASGKITQSQADTLIEQLDDFGNFGPRFGNGTPPPTPNGTPPAFKTPPPTPNAPRATPDGTRKAPNSKPPAGGQNGNAPSNPGDKTRGNQGGDGRGGSGNQNLKDMFGGLLF